MKKIEVKYSSKLKRIMLLYKYKLLTAKEAASLLGMSRISFYRKLEEIKEKSNVDSIEIETIESECETNEKDETNETSENVEIIEEE